jgi:hypothetical protein
MIWASSEAQGMKFDYIEEELPIIRSSQLLLHAIQPISQENTFACTSKKCCQKMHLKEPWLDSGYSWIAQLYSFLLLRAFSVKELNDTFI